MNKLIFYQLKSVQATLFGVRERLARVRHYKMDAGFINLVSSEHFAGRVSQIVKIVPDCYLVTLKGHFSVERVTF